MIQKLTTSTDFSEEPIWVNLDQILKITRLEPRPKMPSTGIEFINGQRLAVFESADEIAILANNRKS
jgi:uncharacterized protein YlzI (FlbEa/FlbD family)